MVLGWTQTRLLCEQRAPRLKCTRLTISARIIVIQQVNKILQVERSFCRGPTNPGTGTSSSGMVTMMSSSYGRWFLSLVKHASIFWLLQEIAHPWFGGAFPRMTFAYGRCWRIKVLSQVSETSQRMTESEDQTVIVIAGKWLAARVFSLFVATSSRTGWKVAACLIHRRRAWHHKKVCCPTAGADLDPPVKTTDMMPGANQLSFVVVCGGSMII